MDQKFLVKCYFKLISQLKIRKISCFNFHSEACSKTRDIPNFPSTQIQNILLVEKMTRFEVELEKGCKAEDIKCIFPGAYQTYKRHIRNFNLMTTYLLEKFNLNITTIKTEASASLLKSKYIPNNYDAVFSAGGDGTYLQAASLLPSNCKHSIPLYGINTDPVRSEGRLCLRFNHQKDILENKNVLNKQKLLEKSTSTYSFAANENIKDSTSNLNNFFSQIDTSLNNLPSEVYINTILDNLLLHKTYNPLFRQRLRIKLLDTKKELSPDNIKTFYQTCLDNSKILYKAVNDVLIAEENCSKTLYAEVIIDDEPKQRIKCSGLLISTGTGSSAWAYNISKIDKTMVTNLLKILKEMGFKDKIDIKGNQIETICKSLNKNLLFDPSSKLLRLVIREPIENRVFKVKKSNIYLERMIIRPLSRNACIYVDGQANYDFPSGSSLVVETNIEDGFWTAY